MSRATDDLLDQLHGSVASGYLAEIKRYQDGEVVDKEGNPLPLPASMIAGAARFLKDNGVDRAIKPNDDLDKLQGLLPAFDDVDEFTQAH